MPDDLSKLAPDDPSRVIEDWTSRKERILGQAMRSDGAAHRSRWRWLAPAAALVLVAGGAAVAMHLATPDIVPVPADGSPSASGGQEAPEVRAAEVVLLETDDGGVGVCVGVVGASLPPSCGAELIPASDFTWDEIDWAAETQPRFAHAIVTAELDGRTPVVREIYHPDDPAAPADPHPYEFAYDFSPLCEEPIRGTGDGDVAALAAAAEALPGYQALWVSSDQATYNVAFTDPGAAAAGLGAVFSGNLCLGTIEGPAHAGLEAAQHRVLDAPPDISDQLRSSSVAASRLGIHLEFLVVWDHEELLADLEALVGPEAWTHTVVISAFYPIDDAESDEQPEPSSPITRSIPKEVDPEPSPHSDG